MDAAKAILRTGVNLVLNPLHQKYTLTLDAEVLQLFWSVMLDEFDTTAFPIDRVAFEMVNEPGNWNTWTVGGRYTDLLGPFLDLVGDRQPGRVTIVPGGEMGKERCPTGWGFTQSLVGLLSSAHVTRQLALLSYPTIISFHYYEPRHFTNQKPSSPWGATRWTENTGGPPSEP